MSSFPPEREEAQQEMGETTRRIKFSDGNHAAHVEALYAWLHHDLHNLPDIDWKQLPSRVMGYLVNVVGDSPFALHIALAVGTAIGAAGTSYLYQLVTGLNSLTRTLRTQCETWNGVDLTRSVWEEYVTKVENTPARRRYLLNYSAITERYVHDYVERLSPELQARIASYLLPRLPGRFVEQHSGVELDAIGQQRRKERSDVLAPLHSVLVALIQLRKQATQRLLYAFREACERVERGEAELPLVFTYEDTLPEVKRHAQTVAELRIEKRGVVHQFKLWDRRSWVMKHANDFEKRARRRAEVRTKFYSIEKEQCFVEYLGDSSNLLWFGDLIANGILLHLGPLRHRLRSAPEELDEKQLKRLTAAQEAGATKGFAPDRPGLLTPAGAGSGQWLSWIAQRFETIVFEPESLYRGCLMGAALATIALTNGSRLAELQQVSADRFKGHSYPEKKQGVLTGKQRVVWLQHLLPKGKKTEAERQLFPISSQSYELLREIGALLKEHHGCIPVVRPHPENTKADDLAPERYLFQWAATPDGLDGALSPADVRLLIRFILHGLSFRTKQGEPFVVSTHLLRHVMATAARHEHEVPVEAIAYVLHHEQTGGSIPLSTQYYSQQTKEQQLTALAEFMVDVEEQATTIMLSMPDERTVEQMDEDLRDVFERWHTLLETTFGFCGNVGLCPRGYQRNLCIGCPHLVPHPEKRPVALKWRMAYAKQAAELEQEGATVDARQSRLQVQELDDLINSMDLMQQAIDDGTRQPVFLQLPSTPYDTVVVDAQT